MESMANNLTYWNARLEAALEIIRAAAERSRAVAEACDIIEEALYYIREIRDDGGNVPLRNVAAAGADAPTRLGRGEQAEGMGGDRQSDKSDRSGSPADSAGSAQSAPPAKKICADVLENDFALGECEDVREAVGMAVAEFGRAAVAEYCGVRPQEIAKAEQGYRVQKVDAAIRPLLPNYHPEGEEE